MSEMLALFHASTSFIGTILAVVGQGTDAGEFEVEDFMLPGYCPQKPFPAACTTQCFYFFIFSIFLILSECWQVRAAAVRARHWSRQRQPSPPEAPHGVPHWKRRQRGRMLLFVMLYYSHHRTFVSYSQEHDLQRSIVRVVIAGNSLSYDPEIGKDVSLVCFHLNFAVYV
jgi:hypothetical protein